MPRQPSAPITDDEIDLRFTYHPAQGEEDREFYRDFGIRVQDLAYFIRDNTVPGREQSLALTELEEVRMRGNQARAIGSAMRNIP